MASAEKLDYSKLKWREVVNGKTTFSTTVTMSETKKKRVEIKMEDWGDKWAISKEEFEKLLKFVDGELEKAQDKGITSTADSGVTFS